MVYDKAYHMMQLSDMSFDRLWRLTAQPGIRQSAITIGGSLVAAGTAAVALLVLTRHLGPVAFGQFSVGFSLLLILMRLNDWGMTTVIQKFGSTRHDHVALNQLFNWATTVRVISWTVTVIVGLLSYQWLAERLRFDQPLIILAAFLLTPVAAWTEHCWSMLQALHRFTQVAVTNAFQGILKIAIAAGFVLAASSNPTWLLVIYAAAPTVPFIWLGWTFPKWFKPRLGSLKHPEVKDLRQLALHAGVAFVIAGIVENIDILFVQRFLDPFEVGLLAGISRIALLFSVLAYALSTVLNPRVARYANWVDQQTFLKKAWILLGLTVVGWLALIPFSSFLIQLTIGSAYSAGTPYLVLLLAASMLTIAVVPFTALFYSINKPWFFSVTAVVQLAIILVGNIGFVPEFGLEAAVWTRLVARLVLLGLTLLLVALFFKKPAVKPVTS